MKLNPGFFSSLRNDYETPPELFSALDSVFHFNLDVCAAKHNAKVQDFVTKDQDGLAVDWIERAWPSPASCWMNPEWGTGVERWTEKALKECRRGATVVALLGARTDTEWFHEHVAHAAFIVHMRGRVKFLLPCVSCGESTVDRRVPGDAVKKLLVAGGHSPRTRTFPICADCYAKHPDVWSDRASNSPGVGSIIPVWIPRTVTAKEVTSTMARVEALNLGTIALPLSSQVFQVMQW